MSKFELWKDKGGEWRWNLKAGNGEVIAVSEGYSSKQGAKKGVGSVRRAALFARIVEIERN